MPLRSLLVVALLLAAPLAAAVTDAERIEVYRQFRTEFDAHRYREALPLAEQLVSLTEQQYGATDRKLANPLTNLGTTHHRLGEHDAAERSYLRSVQILESQGNLTDLQLLRPLQGLGVTYLAVKQYPDAALVLKRAVDLSRNLKGLFNTDQLTVLQPLIEAYVELGQYPDAEKEHQYALRIAELAYGRDDLRLVGPLQRYAHWFEFVGRYNTARVLYARALSIAERKDGERAMTTVDPLRGIARTYRLEYINGSEEEVVDRSFTGSNDLLPQAADPINSERLNPDGEHALLLALDALSKQPTVPHAKRGETLVDLGDWYLGGGAVAKAIETYREAWQELSAAGSTELLSAPRQLAYKPPTSSVTRSRLDPEDAVEQFVEVSFTVTKDGKTADIMTVSSDASEALQKSVINAVRKARYGPRFVDGEPVDAPGTTLRERLAVRRSAVEKNS